MNKKHLINFLYFIAIGLMLTNLFLRGKDEEIEILYWLGLLVFAFAAILQGQGKNEQSD